MDRLKELGRGTQIMFIAAVLLLIDSFFRWQEIDLGVVSAGVSAWDNFLGILMGILTIVLIARIAARLGAVEIPIPLSFATTSFVLGVLIAIFAVLKNLTDDYSTIWSYIGVVLAILVAVGAWMEVQEAGGMEMMRSEASSLGGGAGTAAPQPAEETVPATPPAPAASVEPAMAAEPMAEPAADAGETASEAADTAAETASGATDEPPAGTSA
jgi:hypothetical protein